MQINVRRLRKADGPVVVQGTLDMSKMVEETFQVEAIEPVHADLTAEMTEQLCLVHGKLSTTVTYQCSRCLEPFQTRLVLDFHELFSDAKQPDEAEVRFVSTVEFDLAPYIEEAVNLAIEYRPLCSENCRGLCPTCGVNRNLAACECESEKPVDLRLAALEGLLSNDDSQ